MKKSDELKNERKLKVDAQRVMLEARNATDKKEFSAEERTSFNALNTDIEALDVSIRNAESDEAAEARAASFAGMPVGSSETREHNKLKERYDLHKAIQIGRASCRERV